MDLCEDTDLSKFDQISRGSSSRAFTRAVLLAVDGRELAIIVRIGVKNRFPPCFVPEQPNPVLFKTFPKRKCTTTGKEISQRKQICKNFASRSCDPLRKSQQSRVNDGRF